MKLLVIEDDVPSRTGYTVLLRDDALVFAGGAVEAVALLAADAFEGVISDLVGVGGTQTVKAVRTRAPSLPVVVLTGLEEAPSLAGDPLVRVLIKGTNGPLEARAALEAMRHESCPVTAQEEG